MLSVIRELRVKKIIISKQIEKNENYYEFKEIVNKKKIDVVIANSKDKLNIEVGIWIDFLWPGKHSFILENPLNNNSLVCKFNYNNLIQDQIQVYEISYLRIYTLFPLVPDILNKLLTRDLRVLLQFYAHSPKKKEQ